MKTQAAKEILNGPDYFTCEKFGTRMPKKDCVKRQKRRHQVYSPWIEISTVNMSLDQCQDCEQGKSIMEEVGDGGQMAEDRGQRKTWRRREPKDFSKIMEELGFDTEREMFECLLKDWSQPTVADLVGCSVRTVHNRSEKFGIQCAKPGRRRVRTPVESRRGGASHSTGQAEARSQRAGERGGRQKTRGCNNF